ncbi:hypothetical protein [Pedobacter sp.]|uniref:hypothetical protein n=1 Tax=Pedobacter sp. TaxID=1411316 RepID=UPI0031D5CA2C
MTPEKIEQEILDFLHRINSESPFYLDVVPDPRSTVNGCFDNVEAKIRQDGGTKIVGWQIWKTKHLIEAEFHGVWKKPTGEIIDITPKAIRALIRYYFYQITTNPIKGLTLTI